MGHPHCRRSRSCCRGGPARSARRQWLSRVVSLAVAANGVGVPPPAPLWDHPVPPLRRGRRGLHPCQPRLGGMELVQLGDLRIVEGGDGRGGRWRHGPAGHTPGECPPRDGPWKGAGRARCPRPTTPFGRLYRCRGGNGTVLRFPGGRRHRRRSRRAATSHRGAHALRWGVGSTGPRATWASAATATTTTAAAPAAPAAAGLGRAPAVLVGALVRGCLDIDLDLVADSRGQPAPALVAVGDFSRHGLGGLCKAAPTGSRSLYSK